MKLKAITMLTDKENVSDNVNVNWWPSCDLDVVLIFA